MLEKEKQSVLELIRPDAVSQECTNTRQLVSENLCSLHRGDPINELDKMILQKSKFIKCFANVKEKDKWHTKDSYGYKSLKSQILRFIVWLGYKKADFLQQN